MRMYSNYCNNMDKAQEALKRVIKLPAFVEVLRVCTLRNYFLFL